MKNLIFKGRIFFAAGPKTIAQSRDPAFSLPFATVGIIALIFLLHDGFVGGFRMEKNWRRDF